MRTIYLKERKLPTYSDLGEYYKRNYTPSFEFDHEAPSRGRYRTHSGIRVYESGYVEVESYVHRNPDLRHNLFVLYGLTFLLPQECYGVKFFTPDNVPVAASAITTNMLFLDRQTQRAYSYERIWGTKSMFTEFARIDFAAPGAVPMTYAQVHVNLPNKERVKAVMQEHKEFFKVCATTALLMQNTYVEEPAPSAHAHKILERMLRGEEVEEVPLDTQVRIGRYVAGKAEIGIRGKLTELSTKPYVFPYLKIVVGDGHG